MSRKAVAVGAPMSLLMMCTRPEEGFLKASAVMTPSVMTLSFTLTVLGSMEMVSSPVMRAFTPGGNTVDRSHLPVTSRMMGVSESGGQAEDAAHVEHPVAGDQVEHEAVAHHDVLLRHERRGEQDVLDGHDDGVGVAGADDVVGHRRERPQLVGGLQGLGHVHLISIEIGVITGADADVEAERQVLHDAHAVGHHGHLVQAGLPVEEHVVAVAQVALDAERAELTAEPANTLVGCGTPVAGGAFGMALAVTGAAGSCCERTLPFQLAVRTCMRALALRQERL